MNERISIIVPVYNAEAYLDRCVRSLADQTYSNLEVILVDDGSADGSAELCDAWAARDSRIHVIHKENAGAGMARNSGLDRATGRYVFFVDSDDYMDLSAVEKCVEQMQTHPADVVMFGRWDVHSDGTMKPKAMKDDILFFDGDAVLKDVLPGLFTYARGVGTGVWGKMFDLELIQRNAVRFRSERELLSEDGYFILELFAHVNSVAILPRNLYYYYKNDQSLSRRYIPGHQKRGDAFCEKSLALCRELGYPPEVSVRVQARYHMYTISGMKRILNSSLSGRQKREQLRAVFRDPLLHSTLTPEVLSAANRSSRIFWRLMKRRQYLVCYILIWLKARM